MRPPVYVDEVTPGGGLGDPTVSDPGFVETVTEETTGEVLEALRRDVVTGSDVNFELRVPSHRSRNAGILDDH
ncbi:MAG: hypothetical protein V5A62_10790 [Haloarculaceae archaeon]